MSDESKEKESGHTDEAEDGCDHQAAGASEDEPEQRAENLATVEGVNRHDVEDEKADVDDVKRSDEHINIGAERFNPDARLSFRATNRTGARTRFTSGPAAMLQRVAPGRGGGFT